MQACVCPGTRVEVGNWSPLLLWDPSPWFSTFHHLETLRVFVFSLVCTSWEGGFSTVFSSPLPGPGSKYLDSKKLLFTPVSHLAGFAGNAREHEGLIALGFSFVSPVRRGALSIIAMALVSQ